MPYKKIKDINLNNGEKAELVLVRGATPEWQKHICAFLNSTPTPEGPSLHECLLTNEVPGPTYSYTMVLLNQAVLRILFR